jgi:hypothetical protein
MNILRPVIPSEVKESRERPYEILRLRRGSLRMLQAHQVDQKLAPKIEHPAP